MFSKWIPSLSLKDGILGSCKIQGFHLEEKDGILKKLFTFK